MKWESVYKRHHHIACRAQKGRADEYAKEVQTRMAEQRALIADGRSGPCRSLAGADAAR